MPRRKRYKTRSLSPSVLILVIIASVLLSAGIFYSTALLIGGGGGLPGGGIGGGVPDVGDELTGCALGDCSACETQDDCEAQEGCEWRTDQAPTGSVAISGGLPDGGAEGTCHEKNVHSKTTTGITTTKTGETGISPIDQSVGVKTVTVSAEKDEEISVTVRRLMAKPSGVGAPSGISYRYFQITGSGNVTKVKPDFIVENAWLTANNVDKNTLKVWRATGSTFSSVPTTIVSESDTQIIVRGEASGFSYWAITGEEACSGSVALTMPASAEGGESITATVSGLSNCAGKTVYIRSSSCAGENMCSILVDGGGGSCGFEAANTTDTYTYAACIDKDGDGDFTGTGEADEGTVDVTAVEEEPVEEEPFCGDGTCNVGEDSTDCPADCPVVDGGEPTITVTSEDALAVINNAKTVITDARKEGKDVNEALTLLNDAIFAYNDADYETARGKAEAALTAIASAPEAEPPVELPMTYIILAAIILGALGGGAFLFTRGGKEKRSVKVRAPKR